MRRSWAALPAICVLLAACTQSKVEPGADVVIRGALQRQNGSPVAGERIALGRIPDPLEGLATVFTLGLNCLADRYTKLSLPNACDEVHVATTGGDGTYRFALKGRDTQGTLGQASTLELTALLPRSGGQLAGASASMRFLAQTDEVMVPVRFWEPAVTLGANARDARADWSRLPASVAPKGGADRVTYRLTFAEGDATVWQIARARRKAPFDTRLLEDAEGAFAVTASALGIPVVESRGATLGLILRSPRLAFRAPAGPPPSRGRSCSVLDANDRPVDLSPCGLTDGDFAAPFNPPVERCQDAGCLEPTHREATVDLGAVRPVSLVAVRGCEGDCAVELSGNGSAWRPFATGSSGNGFVAMKPAREARGRYVRVRSSVGIEHLREMSVWAKPPKAGNASSLLVGVEQVPGEELIDPVGPGGGDAFPWRWIVAFLALVALLGAGALRVRRAFRRP
ncbi:MAG TPA: hypothetical protein VGB83_04295 [Actinomycetota bacterium]